MPPRGDVWLLEFGGASARLKDSKGVRDLAWLLAHPGDSIAALDLMGAGKPVLVADAPGPALDAQARAAYRNRLRELEEELDTADGAGDPVRSARLTAERDAIVAELASAYGLGGRSRTTRSSAERARTAVTTRIRDTIRRLHKVHPELGAHLSRFVRTGTFCGYAPDTPARWHVTSGPN